jgi:hypothetical protein
MTDKVRLCLIAPCWPSQAWFPTLLELLTDHPRRLPEWDHLLWHPLGRVYHNSPSFYMKCIEGYKSAIATSLRLIDCWGNVWDDTCATALQNISVAHPRVKVQTPRWNLSLVLTALMEEPFEPMERGSLKNIIFKDGILCGLGHHSTEARTTCFIFWKYLLQQREGGGPTGTCARLLGEEPGA